MIGRPARASVEVSLLTLCCPRPHPIRLPFSLLSDHSSDTGSAALNVPGLLCIYSSSSLNMAEPCAASTSFVVGTTGVRACFCSYRRPWASAQILLHIPCTVPAQVARGRCCSSPMCRSPAQCCCVPCMRVSAGGLSPLLGPSCKKYKFHAPFPRAWRDVVLGAHVHPPYTHCLLLIDGVIPFSSAPASLGAHLACGCVAR